jgi:hypothetical protein
MRTRWAILSAVAVLTAHSPLRAQLPLSQQDVRNFAPATDPDATLYLEKPTTEGVGAYNVGVWFSYANELLLLESASGETASPVEHQLSIDYLASLAFTDRIAVGVALPTVVYQEGEHEELLTDDATLPQSALGDLRVDVKTTLLRPGTVGTLALGALARVTLPTSSELSFSGYDSTTGELRFLAELGYFTLKLQATGGVRLRPDVTVLDQTLGSDLPWGAAALWMLGSRADQGLGWALAAETHGAIGLDPDFAEEIASPVLGGLSVRLRSDDWSLLVGAETGLNAGLGAPRVRAVLAAGYAPRVKDADQDGLEDHVDQCPQVAEDSDDFQDSDGCPEVDNDGDAVSDTDDRCPKELEDADDFEDSDGCPEPDNDGDAILDASDACPMRAGTVSDVPKYHGCPPVDTDGDGVFDDRDACQNKPEDKDGFEDYDGCPDRDNDKDGSADPQDACPDQAGPQRSDPKLNGCPSPDRDGDALDLDRDQCPKEREVFNGLDDEDGCPDGTPAVNPPLVEVVESDAGPSMRLATPISFVVTDGGIEVASQSLTILRAIGTELNQHRGWVLLVGVRPTGPSSEAEQEAINKSFAVVLALRNLTHRESLAESVSWNAVKDLKQAAESGVGLMVLAQDNPPEKPRKP